MYSPILGRFMQTDPIGYADGPNWYNYVGGDPVNRADPSGLADGECIKTKTCPLPGKIPDGWSPWDGHSGGECAFTGDYATTFSCLPGTTIYSGYSSGPLVNVTSGDLYSQAGAQSPNIGGGAINVSLWDPASNFPVLGLPQFRELGIKRISITDERFGHIVKNHGLGYNSRSGTFSPFMLSLGKTGLFAVLAPFIRNATISPRFGTVPGLPILYDVRIPTPFSVGTIGTFGGRSDDPGYSTILQIGGWGGEYSVYTAYPQR